MKAPGQRPHLCLVDGSGFIFRSFHALPPMHRPDGTPVNAVYGFCQMLSRLHSTLAADAWVIVLDAGRTTFRNRIFPGYKAHRPPPPPELVPQFALVREACDALPVTRLECPDFEADDLMATLTCSARARDWSVTMITSDKDMMQLVEEEDRVALYDWAKQKRIGVQDVVERFGVHPRHVGDVLALVGDTADNIPGVPGIGPRTAADLVQTWGSLDRILEHVDQITPEGRRRKLAEHRDQALLSRDLVCLRTDAPVPDDPELFRIRPVDEDRWHRFLEAQNFRSLSARSRPPRPAQTPVVADTLPEGFVENVCRTRLLALWAEPQAGTPDAPLMLTLGTGHNQDSPSPAVTVTATPALVQALFSCTPQATLLVWDHKRLAALMKARGMPLPDTPWCDLLLLAYVARGEEQEETLKGLARLCEQLGLNPPSGQASDLVPLMPRLHAVLSDAVVHTPREALLRDVDHPLSDLLGRMEETGIPFHSAGLDTLGQILGARMEALEGEAIRLAGKPFNLASPGQVGRVLFEDMNLPAPKRTRTGQHTTDADVLEELAAAGYTVASVILEWRKAAKLRSTWVEALPRAVDPRTGRIHTTWRMTATSTGRVSSRHPNVQNIPVTPGDGQAVRAAFRTMRPGFTLVQLDYSQIELRLLAHMAQVRGLLDVFRAGQDLHALTAASLFGAEPGQVTPEQRRHAKTINFGVLYGMSPFGLARQLGIPVAEAARWIDRWFDLYPGIRTFMDAICAKARETGYVETLWGRRCAIHGLNDRHPGRRKAAERQAINAPVQGSQADMTRKAMVQVDRWLRDTGLESRIILQVHDELVLEGPETEAETVAGHSSRIMRDVMPLDVPVVVNSQIRTTWGKIQGG